MFPHDDTLQNYTTAVSKFTSITHVSDIYTTTVSFILTSTSCDCFGRFLKAETRLVLYSLQFGDKYNKLICSKNPNEIQRVLFWRSNCCASYFLLKFWLNPKVRTSPLLQTSRESTRGEDFTHIITQNSLQHGCAVIFPTGNFKNKNNLSWMYKIMTQK